MLQLGEFNELSVVRFTDYGWFLEDEEQNEVLLPNKFVSENMKAGDKVNVFLFKDSEDRITATTQTPLISLNEFASLKVKQVNKVGAFLDWGLEKDLLVPFREQPYRMMEGKSYVVRLIHDEKSDRLMATARLNKYLEIDHITVKEGEEVEIIITQETDLGYKVIVEDAHMGLIYRNEIFQPVQVGDKLKAWVRTVREDGKIDLRLQQEGYGHVEPSSQEILDALKQNNGFLPLHDKSKPEEIVDFLKMSKKTFKKAIGNLYKKKLITLENNGIRLGRK